MTNAAEGLNPTANTIEKKAPIFGAISFSAPLLAYGIGWLVCKDMKGGESGGSWIAAIFLLIVLVTLAIGMIAALYRLAGGKNIAWA